MEKRMQQHAARLAALLTALALFAFLWFRTEIHYALCDDFYLARAFAGEVGGVCESYNYFVHTAFAWLLHGLSLLFPGVWWFSWLQMALLFASVYGVILGAMRAGKRARLPYPVGWALGALFVAGFIAGFCTTVTFTTTCAALAAASVWLLAGVDFDDKPSHVVRGIVGSALPAVCAYLLRGSAGLPAAAFWLGTFVCRTLIGCGGLRRLHLVAKPVWKGLLWTLVLVACLVGVRMLENALTPEQEYIEWVEATTGPIDYGGLGRAQQSTFDKLGWTQNELALVDSWYFLDADMGAQAFRVIEADGRALPQAPLLQRMKDALQRFERVVRLNINVRDYLLILLGACFAAFAASLLAKKRSLWACLAPVGCAAVTFLMLAYLAFCGRLPMRVAALVLLPACAMAEWLMLRALLALWRERRLLACAVGAVALCCLVVTAHCALKDAQFYYRPNHGDPDACVYAAVERYALERDDALLVCDRTLGTDNRLFPDRSAGAPQNLLPMWGSWNNHSEGYRALMARYGFDHNDFHITDFIGGRVRLVCGKGGVSPEFTAYLGERAGYAVRPVVLFEGEGFTVYTFE